MTEHGGTGPGVPPRVAQWSYVAPILVGLLIVAAGVVPGTLLGQLNARLRPDLPWAAVATLTYLMALLMWLHGVGPPRDTGRLRQDRLRLWPPGTPDVADRDGLSPGAVVFLLGLLYLLWIVVGRLSPIPDLSAYPTTAYRWSMFVMGGVSAGVAEEAAFRGYMQTGIERHDRRNAIWITSLVFVAAHVTQGIEAILILGPGLFIASMLYGILARRTGTILPGMAIHVVGDLAHTYFGVLRGDASLLFVG